MDFFNKFYKRSELSKNFKHHSLHIFLYRVSVDSLKNLNFRPISLIRSVYKILAKMLSTEFKEVISPMVNLHKGGTFITGMNILDGVAAANECVDWIHKVIVCKLDLGKSL